MKKALLITVGTGVGPDKDERTSSLAHGIVHLICHYDSSIIVFFGSEESKGTVVSVKDQYYENTKKTLDSELIIIQDINSFKECFDKIRMKIEEYDDHDIVIDYTSGTKTMTMSAAICSMLYHKRLSLVSGQRKNGIVMSGTESIREQNLYAAYDKYLLDKVKDLINLYQFNAAKNVLGQVVILDNKEQCELFIECYEVWDKFDHRSAKEHLNKIKGKDVKSDLSRNKEFLGKIFSSDIKEPFYIADLLNNAKRRASEGKYDDAVARLYRVIEMIAQYKLSSVYQIRTADVEINKIPEKKQKEYESLRKPGNGKIEVGLFSAFKLLEDLGDELGIKFYRNHRLQDLLGQRNLSILAHGTKPIKKGTYEELFQISEGFAQILIGDLSELMDKAEFIRL